MLEVAASTFSVLYLIIGVFITPNGFGLLEQALNPTNSAIALTP
jgi:fucose permease